VSSRPYFDRVPDPAQIVADLIDAWNRRDLDAALRHASPDIEYVNSPLAVEPGTRHGRDEYARVIRAQWEILGDTRIETESIEVDGDNVVVMGTIGRSFGEAAGLSAPLGMRCTLKDGLIVRHEIDSP
jgi:ketosteroid isomerase-like protein